MKRNLVSLLTLSLALLASCGKESAPASSSPLPSSPSGESVSSEDLMDYKVTITNKIRSQFPNLSLSLYQGEEKVASGKTNLKGYYRFKGLAKAAYRLEVSGLPEGYYYDGDLVLNPDQEDQTFVYDTRLLTGKMSAQTPLSLGSAMYDFSGETLEKDASGKIVRTSYTLSKLLATHKAVYLNLWATWCNPCKMELPYLNAFYQAHSSDIAFLALDVGGGENDTEKGVSDFKAANQYSIPMGLEGSLGLSAAFSASSIPFSALIDPEGLVVNVEVGAMTTSSQVEEFFSGYYSA